MIKVLVTASAAPSGTIDAMATLRLVRLGGEPPQQSAPPLDPLQLDALRVDCLKFRTDKPIQYEPSGWEMV